MLQASDEELIARAKALSGQERERAIEQLIERHYERVALWCLRWSGSRDDARDLAQDIFLKVHRNLDSFQGDSKFSTWLYMVCRNHCINAGMASRSRECVELDEVLESTLRSREPDPEQQLASRRRLEAAEQLLNQHLDDVERQVLTLHYLEGLSLPMVSRALKLTNTSGAKAYMVSAHRKLKGAAERLKLRTPRVSG